MTVSAESVNLPYDGDAHGITVSVTDPAGGAVIKYGTEEGLYSLDASPSITDVGESPLTVYYQVAAEGYHTVTGSATVTIMKASAVPTAPAASTGLVYDGEAQALVSAGSTDAGTLLYSTDGENYSGEIPKGTKAGVYTVNYKVHCGLSRSAHLLRTIPFLLQALSISQVC